MPDVSPLGPGKATWIDRNIIEATFPQTQEMAGWRVTKAAVDESGFLVLIRWERDVD